MLSSNHGNCHYLNIISISNFCILIVICELTEAVCVYVEIRYRIYCLIGDGESAEGSIWEALHFASQYRLDNLVAIFDINRLGQSEATSLQHDMDTYKHRLTAFGLVMLLFIYK